MEKALDVTSSKDFEAKVPDIKTFGNPDTWQLLCKASSVAQGWMKSTKVMRIPGFGVLVQVSSKQDAAIAETVTPVEGGFLDEQKDGTLRLCVSDFPSKAGCFRDKGGKWHE